MCAQVGVFVSIVSTKIPFKGAGKEYIGDDVEEMVRSRLLPYSCRSCRTALAPLGIASVHACLVLGAEGGAGTEGRPRMAVASGAMRTPLSHHL